MTYLNSATSTRYSKPKAEIAQIKENHDSGCLERSEKEIVDVRLDPRMDEKARQANSEKGNYRAKKRIKRVQEWS